MMNSDQIEDYIGRGKLPEPTASLDERIDRLLTTGQAEAQPPGNQLLVPIGAAIAICLCLAGLVVGVAFRQPEAEERVADSPLHSELAREIVEVEIPSVDFSAATTDANSLISARMLVVVASVEQEGAE